MCRHLMMVLDVDISVLLIENVQRIARVLVCRLVGEGVETLKG